MYKGQPEGRFSTGQTYNSGTCNELNIVVANGSSVEPNQQTYDTSSRISLTCPYCGSLFCVRGQLLHHIKAKHPEMRFVCSRCEFTFATRGSLKEHIRHVHQKLARYQCEHCGKGYSHRSHYYDHLATHAGVKRNVCEICQKTFTFGHSLKEHMIRVHPDEAI